MTLCWDAGAPERHKPDPVPKDLIKEVLSLAMRSPPA